MGKIRRRDRPAYPEIRHSTVSEAENRHARDLVARRGLALDACGHSRYLVACEPADLIDVVNAVAEQGAKILRQALPRRQRRQTTRVERTGADGLNAPDRSLLDQPVGFTIHEPKTLPEHDHEVYVLPARYVQNLIARLNTRCHGLVQQDVFSRVRGCDCVRGMLTMWRTDEDCIDIMAVYQGLDVSIALHSVIGRQLRGAAATGNTDQP